MDNKVFVYLASVEDFKDNLKLPKYQVDKISNIKNDAVINQKKAVYGLLDVAVKEVFGFEDDFNDIKVNAFGKPFANKYYFSISHTKNLVALAVSQTEVGVDLEWVNNGRNYQIIKKNIVNDYELDLPINSIEDVTSLWVKKEAIFKFLGQGKVFVPKDINSLKYNVKNEKIEYNSESYYLAVCAENVDNVKFVLK